jgi:hypothetical protein
MNIAFLNQLKAPYERDYGRMKKNREDEPIGVIILLYMEISQGNSYVAIFILNSKNVILFSSTKL